MADHCAVAVQQLPLHESWKSLLSEELSCSDTQALSDFLSAEQRLSRRIYPPSDEIFNALNNTPFGSVKVVILGQDPYHGPGQAHGLCFSVRPGVRLPPSLRNIYKEIEADLGVPMSANGCLLPWAHQGVLLLNAVLTVEEGKAASHQGRGWERFTDSIIALLNEKRENLVFLLWGTYAQRKGRIIDRTRHLVLESSHPSPLSAHRGFFGNRHFSRTNNYLQQHGQQAIDWQIS